MQYRNSTIQVKKFSLKSWFFGESCEYSAYLAKSMERWKTVWWLGELLSTRLTSSFTKCKSLVLLRSICGQLKINPFILLNCITPKPVTSLRGLLPDQLRPGNTASFEEMSQQCKPLTTLRTIWPVEDLNLRPPSDERVTALPTGLFRTTHAI